MHRIHTVITLRQLWKITYLGQGYYSIRPMNKLDMALTVSGTNVVIRYAGESDHFNTLANQFKWTITENTLGVVLKNYNDSGRVLSVVNDSTSSGSYTCIRESTSSKQKWQINRLSSPPSGIFLYDEANGHISYSATRYMSLNQSLKLPDFDLVAIRYSADTNSQELSWWSSDNTREPFGQTNSKNIQIDTYIPNIETINGTDNEGNYVQITIITSDIEEGAYRIRNRRSGKYADIFEQRMSAGTNIHQWERHNGESQIWYFHIGSRDGYYMISNLTGGAVYCLGVKGNSTKEDTQIVLADPYGTEDTKWRILGSYAGSYVIRPKTSIDTMALSLANSSYSNGVLLQQKTYTKDQNYLDEWYLERTSGTLNVASYYDLGFDIRCDDDAGLPEQKIAMVQNIVSDKFKSFFNLSIVPLYIPNKSKADDCKMDKDPMGRVTEENIDDTQCKHLFECLTTDKLKDYLVSRYGPGDDRVTKVLWTGHIMKGDKPLVTPKPSDNAIISAPSMSYPDNHVCVITPASYPIEPSNNFSNSILERRMLHSLMHELSHQLGTIDHYCFGRQNGKKCSNPHCDKCVYGKRDARPCIMSDYDEWKNKTKSEIYCIECQNVIANHINSHHK